MGQWSRPPVLISVRVESAGGGLVQKEGRFMSAVGIGCFAGVVLEYEKYV